MTDLPSPRAHTRESRRETDFARELTPIQRTRLIANTRNRHGLKNGSSLCKHFHDGEESDEHPEIKALTNRSFGKVT